ncbi:MAG: GNAT family N-acetyltransferase [Victivallales bacterium]|nr:GNAT family N-acetyltransferase [Victivallales bacterium]
MLTQLAPTILKTGETMQVYRLEPPDDFAPQLVHFLRHKGEESIRGIASRLEGKYVPCCQDHFYFGKINGQMVGHIWFEYGRHDQPIADFGHVYTVPEQRGKGVASALLPYFRADFESSPAVAAFCSNSKEGIAAIYIRNGFQPILPGTKAGKLGMYKQHRGENAFQKFTADYYQGKADDVHLTPGTMEWKHELDCLLHFTGRTRPRAFLSNLVGTYGKAIFYQEDNGGQVLAALTAEGRCVGWFFAIRPLHEPEAIPIFDWCLHPAFSEAEPRLLREAIDRLAGPRPLGCWLTSGMAEKRALLEPLGFRETAAIRDYQPGNDLLLMEMK